jgi:hypothetical protein
MRVSNFEVASIGACVPSFVSTADLAIDPRGWHHHAMP